MFNRFTDWFTPDRRAQIQALFVTLAPIVIGLGLFTESEADQWLIITGASLQFAGSLLNLINVRGGDWWAALRGAIYLLATSVAPALTVLGYIDDATAATALNFLSLGLSSLSAVVGIVTGKQQQLQAVIDAQNAEG